MKLAQPWAKETIEDPKLEDPKLDAKDKPIESEVIIRIDLMNVVADMGGLPNEIVIQTFTKSTIEDIAWNNNVVVTGERRASMHADMEVQAVQVMYVGESLG